MHSTLLLGCQSPLLTTLMKVVCDQQYKHLIIRSTPANLLNISMWEDRCCLLAPSVWSTVVDVNVTWHHCVDWKWSLSSYYELSDHFQSLQLICCCVWYTVSSISRGVCWVACKLQCSGDLQRAVHLGFYVRACCQIVTVNGRLFVAGCTPFVGLKTHFGCIKQRLIKPP